METENFTESSCLNLGEAVAGELPGRRAGFGPALGAVLLLCSSQPLFACDEMVSRMISRTMGPSVQSLGCGPLARAGLDRADHRLTDVCYTSTGPTSSLKVSVELSCKTSDAALIRPSKSENVSALVEVRGSDCAITKIEVGTSGTLAKLLLTAFDPGAALRETLQRELKKLCG